jgi:hypothetical protein
MLTIPHPLQRRIICRPLPDDNAAVLSTLTSVGNASSVEQRVDGQFRQFAHTMPFTSVRHTTNRGQWRWQ